MMHFFRQAKARRKKKQMNILHRRFSPIIERNCQQFLHRGFSL